MNTQQGTLTGTTERLVALTENDCPMFQLLDGEPFMTTLLSAFGVAPGGTLEKKYFMKERIRYVVVARNVVRLSLKWYSGKKKNTKEHDKANVEANVEGKEKEKEKEKGRFQLLALGDFVAVKMQGRRDTFLQFQLGEGTEWVHGAFWVSDDGKSWGRPTPMEKIPMKEARPHGVGVTLAMELSNGLDNEDGNVSCHPFLLPYNGGAYDIAEERGYCRYLGSFFPDQRCAPILENGVTAPTGNDVYMDIAWPERNFGGLIPFPEFKERVLVSRYLDSNGQPKVQVRGPLLRDLFSETNDQTVEEALCYCLDPKLLQENGTGSWEVRLTAPHDPTKNQGPKHQGPKHIPGQLQPIERVLLGAIIRPDGNEEDSVPDEEGDGVSQTPTVPAEATAS